MEIILPSKPKTIERFFRKKISTYKRESTRFNIELPDQYSELQKVGEAKLSPSEDLMVITCKVNGELTKRSAKKAQYNIAKKALGKDFKDGAIFIFYDKNDKYRFSFIQRYYDERDKKFSTWKRFTYFVDPDKNNKTFTNRILDGNLSSLEAIQEAFSVEPLSKQFYKELSNWYFAALQEVEFPNDRDEQEDKLKANAMIRLITRLMFVWFMKQKNLIPDDLFEKTKLDELLNYKDSTGSTYYKAILQNLFFASLNTPKNTPGREFIKEFQGKSPQRGVQNYYRYKDYFSKPNEFINLMDQIPFLNGGLFENLDVRDENNTIKYCIDCFSNRKSNRKRLTVPDTLFFGKRNADISQYFEDGNNKQDIEVKGLLNILSQYDFTIDENTPDDIDVALDPELLGTVFENLLASYNPETQSTARKESGSFYTPRPIVNYMVQESLCYYLAENTEVGKETIDNLFNEEQAIDLQPDEKNQLIRAISDVKILDPACGSGAFPMGCLQKMVILLNRLDPENKYWKQRQKEKLKNEIDQTIDDNELEELKAEIEDKFDDRYFDPDYARKLYLIQHGLYGVDIQPIAMQISKLRFFISLLVEQKINRGKDNFGILPLPNLETKFVAANTLIGIREDINLPSLFDSDDDINKLEDELKEVRSKLFSARTARTKRKYREQDNNLRGEIAKLVGQKLNKELEDQIKNDPIKLQIDYFESKGNTKKTIELKQKLESKYSDYKSKNHQTAQLLSSWNPYDHNNFSEFFDPEWMYGVKAFDIVIGNPPYIQLSKNRGKLGDLYKDENFETFQKTGDIYVLFYEKGLELSNSKGILSYITSNKWMRAGYGKKLRLYFTGKQPLNLIDLGPGIFNAATVDTNILFIRNRKSQEPFKAVKLEGKKQMEQPDQLNFETMNPEGNESWVILSDIEKRIKGKIERVGTPLKEWDINIYRGVLTGYNKAFIIDGKTKEQILDNCQSHDERKRTDELIRPILRGRDIKRYGYDFANKWLINTHNGYTKDDGTIVTRVDVENYPAVKAYLDQHWERLEKRYDQGDTPYNLRSCAYMQDFFKQKIVWKAVGRNLTFSLLEKGSFLTAPACLITSDMNYYILGFLSSIYAKYYIYNNSDTTGAGDIMLNIQSLETIPIPQLPNRDKSKIVRIVKNITLKKSNDEVYSELESKLNQIINDIFSFTKEEAEFIENI